MKPRPAARPVSTPARVYLAGPMRGLPDWGFPAFMAAEDTLTADGYAVFSPARHDLDNGFDPTGLTGHEDLAALGFNLRHVLGVDVAWICEHADAVAVLPGWEHSSGARAEVALAHALAIPVFEVDGFRRVFPPGWRHPALVGLVGQKRSGKDTLAGFLTSRHGFTRLAFADRLKALLADVDPMVGAGPVAVRLSDLAGLEGEDELKQHPVYGPDLRRMWQNLGHHAHRHLHDEVWIRPVLEQAAQHDRVVITDVRYGNEISAIRAAGGSIVRVDRPGLPDDDPHPTEHEWRSTVPDGVVVNDGTLDDLGYYADVIADHVLACDEPAVA